MNITARFRFVSVAGLTLLLQACVIPNPPPKQVSMDDGIIQAEKISSKATKVLNGRDVHLAVILSKNTVNNIKYLVDANKSIDVDYWDGEAGFSSLREKTNPQYIIRWMDKSLTANFGDVRFYESEKQARDSHPDVFAILDIFYNPRPQNVDFIESTIKIEFYDRDFRYISLAQGSGKTKAVFWVGSEAAGVARDRRQAHVRTEALMAMDRSLSKILVAPVGWYSTGSATVNH
jgi:hypothetical protein